MIVVVVSQTREVLGRMRQRFRSRVLEWEHAIMAVLWGGIVLTNPDLFEGPSFVAFKGGPVLWGWAVMLCGVARLVALGINGYMAVPTAMVRALAAVAGIALFGAISLGLLFSWRWGTGLAVYPVLSVFGLFSLYWAVFDVASPDRHDDRGH